MLSQLTARAALSLIVAAATVAATPITATADAEEEVRAAAEGFYAALNEMFAGSLVPMKEAWSHADDVTYMGPGGGYQVGWKQVLASWEEQASMKLGGEVRPERMRIVVGQELAITHNFERGANVGRRGESERVSIRATNVFRNEEGKWKMIGHHTDLLPFIGEDGRAGGRE